MHGLFPKYLVTALALEAVASIVFSSKTGSRLKIPGEVVPKCRGHRTLNGWGSQTSQPGSLKREKHKEPEYCLIS